MARISLVATVECGTYRIVRAQDGKYSCIHNLLTDFEFGCVELIEKIERKQNRIFAHIEGGGEPFELVSIPEDIYTLLEWMVAMNHHVKKKQPLDNETLETSQSAAYTDNRKQTSHHFYTG